MDTSTALRSAAAVLQRPANILPAYFLTPAVAVVTRAVSLLGLALVYLYLETTGRLARFRSNLAASDVGPPPSSETNPEAFEAWVEEATTLVEPLVTPTSVAIVAVTILAAILVSVVLVAAVTAAQLSASYARLCSERGTTAALRGGRRYWLSLLGLRLLEAVLWLLILAAVGTGIALVSVVSPLVGALALLVAVPLAVALLVVIRLVFVFAPVAVIADDAPLGPSVRSAGGFVRANRATVVGYVLVAIAGVLLVGSFGVAFAARGSGSLVGVLGFTLLSPGLDLVKTALYGDYSGTVDPPSPPETPMSERLTAGVRRGVDEMLTFARDQPLLQALSLAAAVAGFAAGWVAIEPFLGTASTSIAERLADHDPLFAALEFGANNWTVAVSTAFAGLAFAVPAVAALFFNGLVFGVVTRTEEALPELLAFVAPHGIFEIPAFVIAGALGLWLGGSSWRTVRSGRPVAVLADDVERAFWVAIGLAVLLVIAAVVEGFVSPYYWRPFL